MTEERLTATVTSMTASLQDAVHKIAIFDPEYPEDPEVFYACVRYGTMATREVFGEDGDRFFAHDVPDALGILGVYPEDVTWKIGDAKVPDRLATHSPR